MVPISGHKNDTCQVTYELCILAFLFVVLEWNTAHIDDCTIQCLIFKVGSEAVLFMVKVLAKVHAS